MSGFFQLCKESYGGLACVQSNRCLSQCKDSQLCTEDHKCRAPHNCKVDRDCKYREECKEDTFGRRTCQLPRITTSTIIQILLTNNECGSVKDCRLLNPNKPVCKEEYGSNTCHLDDTKVCRKFIPGGSKTCVGYTIGEQSQPCFTNKGCQGGGSGKTVCKESLQASIGQRKCVFPEQCLSKCSSDEFCDSNHRCKSLKPLQKIQLGFLIDETCSQKESGELINMIVSEIVKQLEPMTNQTTEYLLFSVNDISFRLERNVKFWIESTDHKEFLQQLNNIK